MVHYAIIADDLSGSSDTAVTFSNYGYKSFVINFPEGKTHNLENCDVVAISTNTRELPFREAKECIVEVCDYLKQLSVGQVYKKIDSTCRGHIGTELEAIMEELDLTFSIICPAFPKTGRIVKSGELLVNGVTISQTAIAQDPRFPIRESYLPDILKKQTSLPVELIHHSTVSLGPVALTEYLKRLSAKGKALILIDAIDDEDLNTISSIDTSLLPPLIFSGSAALSDGIVRNRRRKILPNIPPVCVVVGSVNPQNDAMSDFLLSKGDAEEVYIDPVELMEKVGEAPHAEEIGKVLTADSDVIIRTCHYGYDRDRVKKTSREKGISEPEAAEAIARGMQAVMKEAIRGHSVSGLIVTGGATALHVLRGLKAVGIQVDEELEPGVPCGRILGGPLDGVGIITKAGGFGSETTFADGILLLKRKYRQWKDVR